MVGVQAANTAPKTSRTFLAPDVFPHKDCNSEGTMTPVRVGVVVFLVSWSFWRLVVDGSLYLQTQWSYTQDAYDPIGVISNMFTNPLYV